MISAYVLTPFVLVPDPDGSFYRPQVAVDHDVFYYRDVTGQHALNLPADPNLSVFHILIDPLAFEALEADPNYYILSSTP